MKDQKGFAEQESVEAYVAIATPDGNKRAGSGANRKNEDRSDAHSQSDNRDNSTAIPSGMRRERSRDRHAIEKLADRTRLRSYPTIAA